MQGNANPPIHLVAYGPDAVLVRFSPNPDTNAHLTPSALLKHVERNPPPGLLEVTPAYLDLLLEFDIDQAPDPVNVVRTWLESSPAPEPSGLHLPDPTHLLTLEVVYDGPDLPRVAEHAGLTVPEVIQRHASATYEVRFLGFMPGFPYLSGLDPALRTPRLPTPRTRVPAGSLAIARDQVGIYPAETPGGWNLIGRVTRPIFRPDASSPSEAFLLHPGRQVRFAPFAGKP